MTDDSTPDSAAPGTPEKSTDLDRIAKVIARAGVASRRDAERMIVEGRVTVNGEKITSPALDVRPSDRITVDGKTLDEPQETRLWMYYKPVGLVTSESDEKGRQTVFDALPRDLPRVMTVGRLDLNSEGLLLLTNDGDLKRRLELPSTGWLRRYRVRVNGTPTDLTFDPLRRGVTIDGEDFQPMEVRLDSQQGANAWLTVGIREGRNREIRRAMTHIGLQVNRLIRIGYGPFKLTGMEENEVREIKRKVLRDQLGGLLTGEVEDAKPREFRARGTEDGARRPRRDDGPARPRAFGDDRKGGFGKPRFDRDDAPRKPFARRDDDRGDDTRPARPPRPAREDGERKPRWSSKGAPRSGDDRGERRDGAKPFAKRDDDRKPYAKRDGDGARPYAKRDGDKPGGPRRNTGFAPRGEGAGPREDGYKPRGEGFKPRSEGFKSRGDAGKPRSGGFKSHGDGGKPRGEGFAPRGEGFKPRGEGFKPRGEGFAPRGEGGKPRSGGFKSHGDGGKPRGEGFKPGGPRKGGFSGGPAGKGRPGGAGVGKGSRPAGGGKPRGGPRG